MATVDITINDRIYKITCDSGQEERLQKLAAWADQRLAMIAGEVGQIGDTRLMLLTLLMVSDELFELSETAGLTEPIKPQNMLAEETQTAAANVLAAAAERVRAISSSLDAQESQTEPA